MTPSPETQPVTHRSRRLWAAAIAAIALLALIAGLAVVAFFSLDLLRPPGAEVNNPPGSAPIVAPAPTHIRPEMFAPPSEWDDRVG